MRPADLPSPWREQIAWATAHRLPVTPETVTVLGYPVKATDPAWTGLDFAHAEIRENGLVEGDHHLRVPWAHRQDRPDYWMGTHYRVRPRRKGWRFVREGEVWWLVREGRDG